MPDRALTELDQDIDVIRHPDLVLGAGAVLAPIGIVASRRAWRLLSARAVEPDAEAAAIASSTAEAART